jgi:hypothetical protein
VPGSAWRICVDATIGQFKYGDRAIDLAKLLSSIWVTREVKDLKALREMDQAGIVKLRKIYAILRFARPTPGPRINKLAVVQGDENTNKLPRLTMPAEALLQAMRRTQ